MYTSKPNTVYRGFSIDQNKPDSGVSYDINKRRQQEVTLAYYGAGVKQDNIDRLRNMMENKKVKPLEKRLTMDQIRMKVQYRERQRRDQLQQIFNGELQQFNQITQQRIADYNSQEATIKRLEQQQEQIVDRQCAENEEYVQIKFKQQFENNCDDFRQKQDLINARACKLQWDMQMNEKSRQHNFNKRVENQIDTMVTSDYQRYQQEQAELPAKRARQMHETMVDYDDQVDKRRQYLQSEKNIDIQQYQKEKQLRDTGAHIEQQQKQLKYEQNIVNRDELVTQITLEDEKKKRDKYGRIQEGKQEASMIQREILEDQQQQLEFKQTMNQLNNTYKDATNYRKEQKQFELGLVDQGFVVETINRDYQAFKRTQREDKERKRIADEQTGWNIEIAEHKRQKIDQTAEKQAEKQKCLRDLSQMQQEEAQQKYDQEFKSEQELAYLYNQDYQKYKRTRGLVKEDRNYAAQVKDTIQQDTVRINEKLGTIQDQIKELDQINLLEDNRVTKKKQWYNV